MAVIPNAASTGRSGPVTWETIPLAPVKQPEAEAQLTEPSPAEESKPAKEDILSQPEPEPVPEPVLSAVPPQLQPQATKVDAMQAPAPIKPTTPAAHTRPGSAAHRHKFKTDQAVIMPSGSFGAPLEKVGMQFGSLSLDGEDVEPT